MDRHQVDVLVGHHQRQHAVSQRQQHRQRLWHWVNGADGTRHGNDVYSQTTGIRADYGGDPVHPIVVSNNPCMTMPARASTPDGSILVTGNSVYGQIHSGAFGISNFGGNVEISANSVHDNDNGSVGLRAGPRQPRLSQHAHRHSDGRQRRRPNNVVYSNAIGIQDYFGGYYNTSQVLNNLIYAN